MIDKTVLFGAMGIFAFSVMLSMVLILAPTILPFYSIDPEKYHVLIFGSVFGHVSTLIVISTIQHLMKKYNVDPEV